MKTTPSGIHHFAIVAERDGPFGDYSQGASANKPNPRNVVPLPTKHATEYLV